MQNRVQSRRLASDAQQIFLTVSTTRGKVATWLVPSRPLLYPGKRRNLYTRPL